MLARNNDLYTISSLGRHTSALCSRCTIRKGAKQRASHSSRVIKDRRFYVLCSYVYSHSPIGPVDTMDFLLSAAADDFLRLFETDRDLRRLLLPMSTATASLNAAVDGCCRLICLKIRQTSRETSVCAGAYHEHTDAPSFSSFLGRSVRGRVGPAPGAASNDTDLTHGWRRRKSGRREPTDWRTAASHSAPVRKYSDGRRVLLH